MIEIIVNGEKVSTQADSLADYLTAQNQTKQKFAVAVNEMFIAKTQYHDLKLQDGDRIELVAPMSGG